MNTAHDGKRLGQALFKIAMRLGIAHKVWSSIASFIAVVNMPRRLAESPVTMQAITIRWWLSLPRDSKTILGARLTPKNAAFGELDFNSKHLPYLLYSYSCLAHIINLATQAMISTHSKAKYYNPAMPDEHLPDSTGPYRDEVGLIRAVAVKVLYEFWNLILADLLLSGTVICKAQRALSQHSAQGGGCKNQTAHDWHGSPLVVNLHHVRPCGEKQRCECSL